jgi:hypothetical protein
MSAVFQSLNRYGSSGSSCGLEAERIDPSAPLYRTSCLVYYIQYIAA